MNTSDLIAVFALIVSLLSAWISYCAYCHTVRIKEEESRIAFSREKSEFLVSRALKNSASLAAFFPVRKINLQ